MSTTNSPSSTPNSTPSRPRTAPRPPPSPLRPDALNLHAHTPSPASNLSAVAGSSSSTPRRASTPLSPGTGTSQAQAQSRKSSANNTNINAGISSAGWNDQPPENFPSSNTTSNLNNNITSTRSVSSSGGKTRARDLLRKHYGLGVGPPPPLSGPNKPLDPMDIDSPAFDAKSYYEQLITTSSLSGLLKRENELLSEIRQLESERQSLVYNHHHELIAASDTISAMKNRAESVDADLDKLRVAFSEISRLNEELGIEISGGNDNR